MQNPAANSVFSVLLSSVPSVATEVDTTHGTSELWATWGSCCIQTGVSEPGTDKSVANFNPHKLEQNKDVAVLLQEKKKINS